MKKVSVIIPSRNELFLPHTVFDLLSKAEEEVEIIAVLDGYWTLELPPEDHPLRATYEKSIELYKKMYDDSDGNRIKQLVLLHRGKAMGMRSAINSASEIARGDYLMKVDGHCMFGEGWDKILKEDCDDNWVVVPRRRSLDAQNWTILEKTPVDYEYLCYPYAQEVPGIHGRIWPERGRERKDILVDEDMSFQGSCWFTPKEHFMKRINKLQEEGYGTFIGEPQEVGLKTWLGGGKQVRNKKTWYAHLHKGQTYGRGYFVSKSELERGNRYSVDYWMNNRWPNRIHDIEWLVEKFWPVPSWPEERSQWKL